MKLTRFFLLILSSLVYLFAFNLNKQVVALDTQEMVAEAGVSKQSRGGQVVEQGAYHLEFVPEKGKDGVHLDLYLQRGDNHQAIPNAKVTGQVQLPNGTQKNLTFKYDADGKHYTALLPEKASGQYQVRMTAEMNGQKVNGRFSFKQ